jgi:peptide/nickel transport system permease protein
VPQGIRRYHQELTVSNYLTFRILKGLFVVVLISVMTFIIMRLMPGDPVYLLLGEGQIPITDAQIAAIRAKWGLDLPLHQQYFVWAGNLLRGDFGTSLIRPGVPVRRMIFEAIPVTALLNLYAVTLALIISIPLGVIAAVRRNSPIDYIASAGSAFGIATPNFWLALMLIVLFALYVPRWIGDLPLIGRIPPFGIRSWQGWILPVIVIATEEMAVLTRLTRGTVLELLPQDFVRTARSKGLAQRAILYRHIIANALLPIITVVGFRVAFILSGTIIVETVFAMPGIGRLFTDSVLRLDYQVVQSLVVVFAVLVVVINLLTDLIYALVDPRIRIA